MDTTRTRDCRHCAKASAANPDPRLRAESSRQHCAGCCSICGNMKTQLKILTGIGLALGGIFGIAGTVVASQNLRAVFWALDATGVIVATSLLALMYFRKGNDCVAAGFLVYTIGEAVMLGGTAQTLVASVPAFAAGTALWSAGLVLVSVPKEFAMATRIAGLIGGLLFAISSARIFWGEPLLPISKPLPTLGYPFLVLSFIGWIWALRKAN
jgi:hypothetical protein